MHETAEYFRNGTIFHSEVTIRYMDHDMVIFQGASYFYISTDPACESGAN